MVETRNSPERTSPKNDAKSNKRSGDKLDSPSAKKGKHSNAAPEKGQQTIEESLGVVEDKDEAKDDSAKQNGSKVQPKKEEEKSEKSENTKEEQSKANGHSENADKKGEDTSKDGSANDSGKKQEKNAFDEVKADENEVKSAAKEEQDEKADNINKNNESIVEDKEREQIMPSTIHEKGIIYFFFRGRVGVDEPQGLEDVARSYIVLRPLPLGAKIGSGPLEDTGNSRLLALPKKMLPKSTKDRFLTFVEKVPTSIKDLREQFSGNDYLTQTVGTRHTPAATPFAEGVYAITGDSANSHLVYHITIPEEIGEVQKELGLFAKGSYNISLKNPEAPGPSYATIQNPAKYTKEIQEQFRGRRWMPVTPESLDFEGAQFLLIGEGLGEISKAVEPASKDEKHEKEKPEEEIEKLEEEDHERVTHLKEDDPVFADLGLSSKEYPHLQTTW